MISNKNKNYSPGNIHCLHSFYGMQSQCSSESICGVVSQLVRIKKFARPFQLPARTATQKEKQNENQTMIILKMI
jgi:hypothetical protein